MLEEIEAEVARSRTVHGPIASAHEAIAVIREEYLEAERLVFAQTLWPLHLRRELVQLAAMCVRAAEDLRLREQVEEARATARLERFGGVDAPSGWPYNE